MDYSNLSGLRDTFRIRTGLVEAGASGNTRLNAVLNLAARQLEQDAPSVFKRQEVRLSLRMPVTSDDTGSSTMDVSPLDQRVFKLHNPTSTYLSDMDRGLLVGRWIDLTAGDGTIHTRRILAVGRTTGPVTDDWGASQASHDLIFVDRPWLNDSETEIAWRIYTLDYPLPADVRDIESAILTPEIRGSDTLQALEVAELEEIRRDKWTDSGVPMYYADGDFYQLRAPHDTPVVTKSSGSINTTKWGFSSSGTQDTTYGPAGTFSYCYCLVRGRLSSTSRAIMGENEDVDDFERSPFYISAPSPVSERITTTWGDGMINIGSVDQDWHEVRQTQSVAAVKTALTPVSGLEKWWFRACHASAADNPSLSGLPTEADGIYRLWRIEEGTSVSIRDRGDFDPVDYNFPLKEFAGHKSIRFDLAPDDNVTQVALRCVLRPDILRADSDILPFPPGAATEAVICQAASYICERDGDFDKAKYYKGLYEFHTNKLRERDGWSSPKTGGFGDGISVGNGRSWKLTRRITEST